MPAHLSLPPLVWVQASACNSSPLTRWGSNRAKNYGITPRDCAKEK